MASHKGNVFHQLAQKRDFTELLGELRCRDNVDKIKEKDQFGSTPLHYVLVISSLDEEKKKIREIFDYVLPLLKGSSSIFNSVNSNGYTLLMKAIDTTHYDIAEKLIDYSDVSFRSDDGKTALFYALARREIDIRIIRKLTNPETASNPSVVSRAIMYSTGEAVEWVIMKANDVAYDFKFANGNDVFTLAIEKKRPEIFAILVRIRKASGELVDMKKFGKYLLNSVRESDLKMAECLLQLGTPIDADFRCLPEKNHMKMAKLLLKHGMKPDEYFYEKYGERAQFIIDEATSAEYLGNCY